MTGSARAAGRLPARPGRGLGDAGPRRSLLCLTLAWSLDDARWVLGRETYLDFLAVASPPAASSSGSSARRSAGVAGRPTWSGRSSRP